MRSKELLANIATITLFMALAYVVTAPYYEEKGVRKAIENTRVCVDKQGVYQGRHYSSGYFSDKYVPVEITDRVTGEKLNCIE